MLVGPMAVFQLPAGPAPVPVAGRPETFTGAVGQFSVTARVAPAQFSLGETCTYSLRVTGTGDLSRAEPPVLLRQRGFADRFEIVEPPRKEVTAAATVFAYRLRAKRADVGRVPAVRFSYYHPGQRRFETVLAGSLPVTVLPTEVIGPAAVKAGPLPPVPAADTGASVGEWWAEVRGVLPALSVLVALSVLGIMLRGVWRRSGSSLARSAEPSGPSPRRSPSPPREGFAGSSAAGAAGSAAGAGGTAAGAGGTAAGAGGTAAGAGGHESVRRGVLERLGVGLGLPPAAVTTAEVIAALRRIEIPEALLAELVDQLQRSEQLCFGGSHSRRDEGALADRLTQACQKIAPLLRPPTD